MGNHILRRCWRCWLFEYPNIGQNDERPQTPGFRRGSKAPGRYERHPQRDPRPLLAQVDTESRILHVKRLKEGLSTTHPLRGDELKAIKKWLADRARMKPDTDAFFIS